MDYVVLKWIHVLSSTILFGAGVGSAFHLFALVAGAVRDRDRPVAAVVVIQIRMRNVMAQAQRTGGPVPAAYGRMFHWWTGLGCAAFIGFLLIFWLMVAKRLPWAE